MSETETIKTRKVGVTFSRKLSDGNYGGSEASAWVEGNVPDGANPAEVAEALGNLYTSAKAAVLDELGIEWHLDPDTALVMETATPFVSTQHAQAAVNRQFAGTSEETPATSGGIKIMNEGKPGSGTGPIDSWALAAAKKDGVTALWDNRGSRDDGLAEGKNLPAYKEAVPRGGTGHGKDGTAKGYWPPK
jgi:hypothetical protein